MKNIFAYTHPTAQYPAYVSINRKDDGKYYIAVRSQGEQMASEMEIPLDELIKMSGGIGSIFSFESDD